MHLNDIPSKEFMPGLHGKIVHGEQLSWAFWKVQQGAIVHIPSNSPHAGKALTQCHLMDVFSPTRNEYKV